MYTLNELCVVWSYFLLHSTLTPALEYPDFAEHPVWPRYVVENKKYAYGVYMLCVWTVLLVMDLTNDFEYSSCYWLLER